MHVVSLNVEILCIYTCVLINLFWRLFFEMPKLCFVCFVRDSPAAPLREGSELHTSPKIIIQVWMQNQGQMHCQWNKLPAGYLALMQHNHIFSQSSPRLKLPFGLISTIHLNQAFIKSAVPHIKTLLSIAVWSDFRRGFIIGFDYKKCAAFMVCANSTTVHF